MQKELNVKLAREEVSSGPNQQLVAVEETENLPESGMQENESCRPDGEETDQIGAYVVIGKIGEGGMGIVYKVRHKGAQNLLAMKVLRQELAGDPVNVKRFQQELRTTSLLTHPNVVPIYDSGVSEDGRPFFVMELLEGYTLQEQLAEEGFIDVDQFLQVFSQVCDALQHAHEKKVIHRDLKPSNIMLTASETSFELVKVLDFGIARVFQKTSKEGLTRLTQVGEVLGSPVYMSPEQCLSQKLDERSDVYSLGVVMYEALSGTVPFSSDNAVEIIMGHLQGKPPRLNKVRPDFNIPADLENLIYACLEKDAALRPATIRDVAAELQRIAACVKNRNPLRGLKQIPRRLARRVGKACRKLVDPRERWGKRLTFSAVALTAGVAAYHHYANSHTPQEFIQQATLARAEGEPAKIASNWDNAIELAQRGHASSAELCAFNERAADDLASYPYRQFSFSNSFGSWEPLDPVNESQSTRQVQVNAKLAMPYLERALALSKAPTDRRRILDKLCAVCSTLKLDKEEIQFLTQRMSDHANSEDSGAALRLGELFVSQGKFSEAEKMLKEAIHLEQLNQQSYVPTSVQEKLHEFYVQRKDFTKEEQFLRSLIEDARTYEIQGNSSDTTARQRLLSQLSACLRRQGKNAESESYLQEIQKLKAKKLDDKSS